MEHDLEKGGSSERYRVEGGPPYKSSVFVGGCYTSVSDAATSTLSAFFGRQVEGGVVIESNVRTPEAEGQKKRGFATL